MAPRNAPKHFLILALLLSAAASFAQDTALDRYVKQRDPVYGWKLVTTIPGTGFKTYVLELTSQTWRTEKDVDRRCGNTG
jgi:hypothetical protein